MFSIDSDVNGSQHVIIFSSQRQSHHIDVGRQLLNHGIRRNKNHPNSVMHIEAHVEWIWTLLFARYFFLSLYSNPFSRHLSDRFRQQDILRPTQETHQNEHNVFVKHIVQE